MVRQQGMGSNRGVVFVLRGKHSLPLDWGGRAGKATVDKSEFDNAMASAAALGNRGVRAHYVLTFISITFPANSALASLQASRKCNKIEGCVLSSRSEEKLQRDAPHTMPRDSLPKGPADNASKPRPQAEISRPSWPNWAQPLQKGRRGRGKA